MKHITSTFLKGLFTLLPLILSIYVFVWFLHWVEGIARGLTSWFWPDWLYIPGMGIVMSVILIYAVGTIVEKPYARWLFNLMEGLFTEVPIIKTVYVAIKDFTEFLKPSHRKGNQVVVVKFEGSDIEMVGLLTREASAGMPEGVSQDDRVAVFFPYSYQLGGFTLFVPRAWVRPTQMPVEAAMRSIITAWLPGQDKKLEGL